MGGTGDGKIAQAVAIVKSEPRATGAWIGALGTLGILVPAAAPIVESLNKWLKTDDGRTFATWGVNFLGSHPGYARTAGWMLIVVPVFFIVKAGVYAAVKKKWPNKFDRPWWVDAGLAMLSWIIHAWNAILGKTALRAEDVITEDPTTLHLPEPEQPKP